MKLQTKIMLVVSLAIIGMATALGILFYHNIHETMEKQMGQSATDMAAVVADMPVIAKALGEGRKDGTIQALADNIRRNTRYQYIIVMDMTGIQYSYPYASGLYKPYKNGGEERMLELGEAYQLADTNELISAIRAFRPIYHEGIQVGGVLVGLLTDEVHSQVHDDTEHLEWVLAVALILGVALASLLSINIKKATFGLEPKEIALLATERNLILQSLERGIFAIDKEGRGLFRNKKASLMLDLPSGEELEPEPAWSEAAAAVRDRMLAALQKGEGLMNERLDLCNGRTLLMSLCLMDNGAGKTTGVVANLEDLTQIQALAEELTGYRMLVDSLRAQKHEFMNRLMTISGLIQLEEYDEVLGYIAELSSAGGRLQRLFSEDVRDVKVAGLLLAKYTAFTEKKVELVIDDDTYVDGLPKGLTSDEACSIIGNLLDNSLDAIGDRSVRRIELSLFSDGEHFDLTVWNSGPEMNEEAIGEVFKKGYSTKGDSRGLGLYLVKSLVDKAGGSIEINNMEGVEWHVQI